jgi:hypothetical protein
VNHCYANTLDLHNLKYSMIAYSVHQDDSSPLRSISYDLYPGKATPSISNTILLYLSSRPKAVAVTKDQTIVLSENGSCWVGIRYNCRVAFIVLSQTATTNQGLYSVSACRTDVALGRVKVYPSDTSTPYCA